MKGKGVLALSGCIAALFCTAMPYALAAPKTSARLIAANSRSPQVFTLRYVAFVAQPRTKSVAAQYKRFPPVLDNGLNNDSRYAMTTTPNGFLQVLQANQPDHEFRVVLAGSVILTSNDTPVQISDGPNPADPYRLTLNDVITVRPNDDGTLDFKAEGKLSYLPLRLGDMGGAWTWKGENDALMVGRTYLWGVDKKPNGTCITWAFCILPGQLDQVASAWKRTNGTRDRAVALGKKTFGKNSGRKLP